MISKLERQKSVIEYLQQYQAQLKQELANAEQPLQDEIDNNLTLQEELRKSQSDLSVVEKLSSQLKREKTEFERDS